MRSRFRESLNIPADAPLVGIVAALREEKNHSQFVLASREILRAFPDTRFVIVGDGPMRGAIENQINELGLTRFFHMLGTRSDTPDILAALDVFVLTSKNEANPVSILEALATCTPVVSPNVGSIPETVIDGQTGYLTSVGNVEETADAVTRLLCNRLMAAQMGRSGRDHVRRSWSLRAMVTGYERLITMLYNDKVPAHRQFSRQASLHAEQVLPTALLTLPDVGVSATNAQ